MSKSTGNVVLVSDVAGRGLDPLSLRLAFLQHRYRQQMNLTWEAIEAADAALSRWRSRVAEWASAPSEAASVRYFDAIVDAFADDLDTPRAIVSLRQLDKDPDISDGAKFATFSAVDALLGLDLLRDVGRAPSVAELSGEAQGLLDRRAAARAAKDWAQSDELRDVLANMGVVVKDTAEGQQVVR